MTRIYEFTQKLSFCSVTYCWVCLVERTSRRQRWGKLPFSLLKFKEFILCSTTMSSNGSNEHHQWRFEAFGTLTLNVCQFGFGSLSGPFISEKLILVRQAALWCNTFWPNWSTQLQNRNVAMYSYFIHLKRKTLNWKASCFISKKTKEWRHWHTSRNIESSWWVPRLPMRKSQWFIRDWSWLRQGWITRRHTSYYLFIGDNLWRCFLFIVTAIN